MLFHNTHAEREIFQDGIIFATFWSRGGDLAVEISKDGFVILGETYPSLSWYSDLLVFRKEISPGIAEEVTIGMPSAEMAETIGEILLQEHRKR